MPRYSSSKHFTHEQPDKVGVLMVNLGTPDAPTPKALRRYLKQFLSDPRVVEVPRVIWWLVLNLIILTFRPARSAKAYQSVWTEKGSPIMVHAVNQRDKVAAKMAEQYGDKVMVELAMSYGNPSIPDKLSKMRDAGVRHLIVLPLYPQYSGTTTASVFDAITSELQSWRWIPELRFINQYHDDEPYIKAVANSIRDAWAEREQPQKLLFSFHGIPQRYLLNGDPYHCQCHKTGRLIAEQLGLSAEQWMVTFQSRFGREPWLQPYTDFTLKALPDQGVKKVDVVCPGFSADCLETIEEIDEENREYFMQAGGEAFHYIEALNDRDDHIDVLSNIINQHMQGWDVGDEDYAARAQRAKAIGSDV